MDFESGRECGAHDIAGALWGGDRPAHAQPMARAGWVGRAELCFPECGCFGDGGLYLFYFIKID